MEVDYYYFFFYWLYIYNKNSDLFFQRVPDLHAFFKGNLLIV